VTSSTGRTLTPDKALWILVNGNDWLMKQIDIRGINGHCGCGACYYCAFLKLRELTQVRIDRCD
jgi:hypothetical protein